MPEILPDHVPSPRTPLVWDGTRYRAVRGHTDGTVQVRGEDQLFSIDVPLSNRRTAAVSGAGGFVDSNTPPAGTIWIVTNVVAIDLTSPTTQHQHHDHRAGTDSTFHVDTQAFGAGGVSEWHGHLYLGAGDTVRIEFIGSLVGDTCRVNITGYQMTLEV